MASRDEIGFPEGDFAKSVQTDRVEEWGAFMCKSCNEILKMPVFFHPPEDKEHWGHCNQCNKHTERERLDEK